MKNLSLRPYHGEVWLFTDLAELRDEYRELCGTPYPYEDEPTGGRYVLIERETIGDRIWLIYAVSPAHIAHELCHVLLQTFDAIGHDPTKGDGEPFCYMLSQLMTEAEA